MTFNRSQRRSQHPEVEGFLLFNCVVNKMLKHDWLSKALIYCLISCLRSTLSELTTCPVPIVCNQTGQIGQLRSQ